MSSLLDHTVSALLNVESGPFNRLFERDGEKIGYVGGVGVSYPPTEAQLAVEELIAANNTELIQYFELAATNASELLPLYLQKEQLLKRIHVLDDPTVEVEYKSLIERIRESEFWTPMGLFYLFLAAKEISLRSVDGAVQLFKIIQTIIMNPVLRRLLNINLKDTFSGCIIRTTSCLQEMRLEDAFCDNIPPCHIAEYLGINIDFAAITELDITTLRDICALPTEAGELQLHLGINFNNDETMNWLQFRTTVVNFRQSILDPLGPDQFQ